MEGRINIMLRFINADVFVGLAREAVLGYIKAGKPAPTTWKGVEEMLLTVMDEKEFKRLDRMPRLDEANTMLALWLMENETTKNWFAASPLGEFLKDFGWDPAIGLSPDQVERCYAHAKGMA